MVDGHIIFINQINKLLYDNQHLRHERITYKLQFDTWEYGAKDTLLRQSESIMSSGLQGNVVKN